MAKKAEKLEKGRGDTPPSEERARPGESEESAQPGRRRLPLTTLLVAAGVLLMEGTTVGVMMWLNRGPAAVSGAAPESNPMAPSEDVEELILEGKAANTKRGATYVYRFKIHAVLAKQDVTAVRAMLEKRKATVEDTVRQVVARLDPKDLDEEPKLVTFRRVLVAELEPVFGPNRIKQLLVPEWSRIRVD